MELLHLFNPPKLNYTRNLWDYSELLDQFADKAGKILCFLASTIWLGDNSQNFDSQKLQLAEKTRRKMKIRISKKNFKRKFQNENFEFLFVSVTKGTTRTLMWAFKMRPVPIDRAP